MGKRLLSLLFFLLFFITPLLTPFGSWGYEQVKVSFFLLISTVIILLFGHRLFQKKYSLHFNWISYFSLLFFLSLLTASLLGIDPLKSIWGREPYFQGVIVYFVLLCLSVVISSIRLNQNLVFLAIVSSGVVVALIGIKDFILIHQFHLQVTTYAGRVVSTFGQPNFFASWLLFGLVYLLFENKLTKYPKYLKLVLVIVLSGGILVSQSKAAIGLMIFLMLFWGIRDLFHSTKMSLFLLSLAMVLILPIHFLLSPLRTNGAAYLNEQRDWIYRLNDNQENRLQIWGAFVFASLKRPILGYGLSNLEYVYASLFRDPKSELTILQTEKTQIKLPISLASLRVDSSHNLFLDLFIDGGIVTLGCFISLLILLIKKAQNQFGVLMGLLTFLIWSQIHNLSIINLIYFWLLVGMLSQKYSHQDRQ